mmetsp:Transcript_108672/g.232163  ORF Transcript_108672/g.232163 Transcript_108672/m.232163 type:complete len:254 (+) Transcript_108672:997-1758(+)
MSNLPSNLPKVRHPMSCRRRPGVKESVQKGVTICSQCVTASKVNARKTFPFDQQTALGNNACNLATVVPLPVPLNPCNTNTQPECGALPSFSMIKAATWSADLPKTSIVHSSSTGGFASITPLATACAIPAASFSSSSASRCRMPSVSFCERPLNVGSASKAAMIVLEVTSSPASSNALLNATDLGGEGATTCTGPTIAASSACKAARTSADDGSASVLSFSKAAPIILCAARRMPMMIGSLKVSSKRWGVRT